MLRLDIHEEESKFRQLDLFASSPPNLEDDLGEDSGIKYGTDSVPDLTGIGTEIDTGTVPKMGHSL